MHKMETTITGEDAFVAIPPNYFGCMLLSRLKPCKLETNKTRGNPYKIDETGHFITK